MSSSIGALKLAAKQILDRQLAEWREILNGLDAEALNWKPAREANSIAALVAHTMDSTRYHLANAAGIELPRDRESKFEHEAANAGNLLALIDEVEPEMRAYLDQITADDLPLEHTRPSSITGTRTHNGAYYLIHALQHAREHIGHANLTRQIWEKRRG